MYLHDKLSEARKNHRWGIGRIILMAIAGVTLATVFAFLFGWLVQFLWNKTLSPIFSISAITYWQAVGLLILSKLLFSGIDSHHKAPQHIQDIHNRRFHRHLLPCSGDDEAQKMYHSFWEEKGERLMREYMDEKLKHNGNFDKE